VVETNYTYPLAAGSGCFHATTNGLAAGNHLLEAVSHALCEVIERDAIAVWLSRGADARTSRKIDLGTIGAEPVVGVLDLLGNAGIEVAAWDVTSDVGVASVFATIVDRPSLRLRPVYPVDGSGCHPTRDIALLRALLEAVQSRLTFIAGSRDDNFYEDYDRLFDPANALAARARVAQEAVVSLDSLPDARHETFLEDVEYELDRLRAAGITEAVVVDLTRADVGLPVVRVVVPGLEGVSTKPDYVAGRRARTASGATVR
jgi:ribosomal protein S12 methylthiotransferase accessory factor